MRLIRPLMCAKVLRVAIMPPRGTITLAVAKSGHRALAALLGKNRISARTRCWEKRLEIFVGENGKAVYSYKLPDGAIIQCNKERIVIKNGKSSIKRILCSKIVADYKE
ncbi:MAG: hypothetical protein KH334_00145 [Clostridiales bacterium]|nr:hypothetical protein [Clostridiales bacterium]